MMEKSYDEELTWIESEDSIRLYGAVIRPSAGPTRSIGVIHIPGWDVRFTHPVHVLMGRTLAAHGYVSIVGNNRGWPFGEIIQRRDEYIVIGAGWERFHECPLDIGAWVTFALGIGFQAVALLGHSLGGAKIVYYQAQRQDPHVVGLICASPAPIRFVSIDPQVVAEAKRLVAQGRGTDLMPWGSYGEKSTLSAQTLLDWSPYARAMVDVFGVMTPNPKLALIRCPLFAFYGTEQDAGTADDLELIRRNAVVAARVDTTLLEGLNHAYAGHEETVGCTVAAWLDTLVQQ